MDAAAELLRRQRVNDFARTRVAQLFACLVLDRIRIVLEPVDVALQPIVLAFENLHLLGQHVGLMPLLLIHGQPIRPENNVIANRKRKRRGSQRRSPPPPNSDHRTSRTHGCETTPPLRNYSLLIHPSS